MDEAAVVPFPAPSRSLFRSILAPYEDTRNHESFSTLPLVPAPYIPQVGSGLGKARKWSLAPSGPGYRWQPENSMVTSSTSTLEARTQAMPYSPQEYEQYLRSPGWDLEETNYLMELCCQLNYRFIIIADRYDWRGKGRVVEELRERYYHVTAELAKVREGEAAAQTWVYDKAADQHFRLGLEKMYAERTVEGAQEEIILSEMLSQVRISLPRILQEREKLLLTSAGLGNNYLAHQPTLPELTGAATRPRKGSVSDSKKSSGKPHKHNGTLSSLPRPPDSKKKSRGSSSRHLGSDADLEVWDEKVTVSGAHHAGVPGRKPKPPVNNTLTRSTQLKPIRVGLTRQVDKLLVDLGFGTKPLVPTARICERFDQLRMLLATLAESQKTLTGLTGTGSASASRSESSSRRPSRPATPGAASPEPSEIIQVPPNDPTPTATTPSAPKRSRKE